MPLAQVGQAPVTQAELVSGRGRSILHTRVAGGLVESRHPGAMTGITNESLLPVPPSPCIQTTCRLSGPWRGTGGAGGLPF